MKDENKAKLKFGFKITTISSPGLVALFMYPTETFAFLKMLKEAGFEAGTLIVIIGIAWWLRKDTIRIVGGEAKKFNANIENLGSGLKSLGEEFKKSNEENSRRAKINDERFLKNDEKFIEISKEVKEVGQKVLTIETRLQGIVPAPTSKEMLDLAEKVSHEASPGQDLTPSTY